ncbi:hypothetical protein ACMGT0_20565 [Pseudomonas sp. RHF3.3-3]|uniref:hypothetical protein n=1 Tax=Pseudomonas sp. RHF3.3-3 TaxID=3396624 RepID=UPI003A898533
MTADTRAPEIQRLEHLLEGMNYSAWVGVYGPFNSDCSLEEQLRHSVSNRSVVGRETPVPAGEVRSQVLEHLLHSGDGGYGPVDLPGKRLEIIRLAEALLSRVRLDQADTLSSFWLAEGHPAYPVWWDFAFDIHADGQRWILMGSASD